MTESIKFILGYGSFMVISKHIIGFELTMIVAMMLLTKYVLGIID